MKELARGLGMQILYKNKTVEKQFCSTYKEEMAVSRAGQEKAGSC